MKKQKRSVKYKDLDDESKKRVLTQAVGIATASTNDNTNDAKQSDKKQKTSFLDFTPTVYVSDAVHVPSVLHGYSS